MLQIFMFTFHTLNMMIIVEPAHRSTEEVQFHLNDVEDKFINLKA